MWFIYNLEPCMMYQWNELEKMIPVISNTQNRLQITFFVENVDAKCSLTNIPARDHIPTQLCNLAVVYVYLSYNVI